VVFNVGRILGLNNDLLLKTIGIQIGNTFSDRLVSCCSAYSIIKCCYCQQSEISSLAKSASIGYRLKSEMATDGICLHFKINSKFTLIHEK